MAHVIVITDDNADMRALLRMTLEDEGYVVLEAGDGEECWEIIQAARQPLIVLLDHVMPRLRGIEVLERVSAHPTLLAAHHFFLVTASPEIQRLDLTSKFPPPMRLRLLMKPFIVEELLARLRVLNAAPDSPT